MTRQIRNPKSETIIKSETRMPEKRNRHAKALFGILNFDHSDLFRVSIFGF